MTTLTAAQDLAERWAPSESQIAKARVMLAGYEAVLIPEIARDLRVLVPIFLANKDHGIWTTDVEVDHVEGWAVVAFVGRASDRPPFMTSYGDARDAAENAASGAARGRKGTASYASIDSSGRWAVFEGF